VKIAIRILHLNSLSVIATVARSFFSILISLLTVSAYAQQLDHTIQCAHAKSFSGKQAMSNARQQSIQDDYDVKFYGLEIKADNQSAFIYAKVAMKAQVLSESLSEIGIGLSELLQVDSVFIDGAKSTFTHSNNQIVITAPQPMFKNQLFTTTVYYQGNGQQASFFSGISNRIAFTGDEVTFTLSEPENATDWFACKQVLSDKADSADIFITVPSNLKAGSNGVLTKVVDVDPGHKRFEWKTRYPIAYYLISLAVAEYDEYTTTATVNGKEMPVQNFLYKNPDVLAGYKALLDQTGPMVEELSGLYGPYPFADEKYGHAMAPLGGGMEHQTMSTMDGFNFTLVAHELGHQWFGDNVTCGSWQDIWINEGFARYSEYLMIERLISKAEADAWMGMVYDHALQRTSGSVYVPLASAQDENRIFDGALTYNKGGALVHMIRYIINDDNTFFAALTQFQQQYKNKVATGEDMKGVLESVTGKDFDQFFDEWYYGQGFPEVRVRWNYDNDTLYIKQTQETSHPSVDFFHFPVDYVVQFEDNTETVIRLETESDGQVLATFTGKPVKKITLDPARIIFKKISEVTRDLSLTGIVTAAEDELEKVFDIYPNPAVSTVNIRTSRADSYSIHMVSANGAVVLSRHDHHGDLQIPASSITPGLYAIRILTANGAIVKKVVVSAQ
jgi:aminopeptidase N